MFFRQQTGKNGDGNEFGPKKKIGTVHRKSGGKNLFDKLILAIKRGKKTGRSIKFMGHTEKTFVTKFPKKKKTKNLAPRERGISGNRPKTGRPNAD